MNAIAEIINEAGKAWWPYVWHATWTSSLVAILLLAAVRIGGRLPARVRHAIVLIALVKFAVPPMLAMPTGLFGWVGPAVAWQGPEPGEQEAQVAEADSPGAAEAAGFGSGIASDLIRACSTVNWRAWLMMVHACGAVIAAACLMAQWVELARLARRARSVTSGPMFERFSRLCRAMGLRRPVRLLVLFDTAPPMAFGLLRRWVVVPASMYGAAASAREEMVLAHELGHHRRGDLWVSWLQGLVAAAWWFNPVLWLVNRALRRTSEDCCDDLVLSRKPATCGDYCQALLHVACRLKRQPMLGAALGFAERLHPLGRRLKRIMDPRLRTRAKRPLLAAAATAVVAALVLPGLRTETPTDEQNASQVATATEDPHSQGLGSTAERTSLGEVDLAAIGDSEPSRMTGAPVRPFGISAVVEETGFRYGGTAWAGSIGYRNRPDRAPQPWPALSLVDDGPDRALARLPRRTSGFHLGIETALPAHRSFSLALPAIVINADQTYPVGANASDTALRTGVIGDTSSGPWRYLAFNRVAADAGGSAESQAMLSAGPAPGGEVPDPPEALLPNLPDLQFVPGQNHVVPQNGPIVDGFSPADEWIPSDINSSLGGDLPTAVVYNFSPAGTSDTISGDWQVWDSLDGSVGVVPEPGTFALLATGICLTLPSRRRRRRHGSKTGH